MNILNVQEAFEALQKGKNLLCRYLGSDFTELDQFPATVFGSPDYEFCIDIGKIELAGITFTKPCLLDEMKDGQQIFIVDVVKCAIISGGYNAQNTYLNTLITNGVVQHDLENAKSHLKAFQSVIGIEVEPFITDCDPIFTSFDELKETPVSGTLKTEIVETPPAVIEFKSKAKRTKKETAADNKAKEIEANKNIVLEAISACTTAEEVETTYYGLEVNGFNFDQLKAIEDAKNAKLEELEQIKAAVESQEHSLFNTAAEQTDSESAQPTTNTNQNDQIAKDNAEWKAHLNELLEGLKKAKTPVEANAFVNYTKSWTKEQREPLIRAISRRLQEINTPQPSVPPSLMERIRNAADLTELDALEIDVSGRHPDIQPRLMAEVKKRRVILEGAIND